MSGGLKPGMGRHGLELEHHPIPRHPSHPRHDHHVVCLLVGLQRPQACAHTTHNPSFNPPCHHPLRGIIPLVGPSVKSTVFFFLLLCRSARVVTQAPMAQNRDWVYMVLLMLLEARGNGLA